TLVRSTPVADTFGVEMRQIAADRGLGLAAEAGIRWVRRNGLLWAAVEAAPGERNWDAVAGLESELRAAHERDLQVILVVRHAPAWAQAVPGHACGPVAPEALDDLAQFMFDVVQRYSAPPFGVRHWELWNEPDVDPDLVAADSPFGCWGDMEDPYYGAGTYAQMLQAVYPAIKAADPGAQVLLGGLLLDREPAPEDTDVPGRFLEGVLHAGGGDYFDIVSFHAYAQFWGEVVDWEMQAPAWAARGGIVAGKVSFLREVLADYGYEKPLMLTESGLLCRTCETGADEVFLSAQAAYVPRLYVRNDALGLMATIWYTLEGPGWRNAGLLEADAQPRPSFRAFQILSSSLPDECAMTDADSAADVARYVYHCPDGQIWVLWSRDGSDLQFPAPKGFQEAYDLYGEPIAADGRSITVGFEPIYLQISAP
ncbi:MAG: hypothetical protein ACP5JJ_09575, partial [Anaerolineae bacterium]